VSVAAIGATNIFNHRGGLISSVTPVSGLAAMTSAAPTLDLFLSAVQNIVNAGSITSSGNLTARAGGSIINALPAGVTGPVPVMQAAQNVNLVSNNIVNSGLVASLAGNINAGRQQVANLVFDNAGGKVQALLGSINIRAADFVGKASADLLGGDWFSSELNVF